MKRHKGLPRRVLAGKQLGFIVVLTASIFAVLLLFPYGLLDPAHTLMHGKLQNGAAPLEFLSSGPLFSVAALPKDDVPLAAELSREKFLDALVCKGFCNQIMSLYDTVRCTHTRCAANVKQQALTYSAFLIVLCALSTAGGNGVHAEPDLGLAQALYWL